MRRIMYLGLAGWLTAMSLLAAPIALAKDGDVIKEGPCSAGSQWKLKSSPENNGATIEVEYEVDQNVIGQTWRVVLRYERIPFFRGDRVTEAPSGSFSVNSLIANQPGPDRIIATAVNYSTGEKCRGAVVSNF